MPIPVARHAGGQHQQRWYAQGAGEMCRRLADRYHNVAGTDQRGKAVEQFDGGDKAKQEGELVRSLQYLRETIGLGVRS